MHVLSCCIPSYLVLSCCIPKPIISRSQRSLHNAPIFRLLLMVAVNGTHQCDFLNFCRGLGLKTKNLGLGMGEVKVTPK